MTRALRVIPTPMSKVVVFDVEVRRQANRAQQHARVLERYFQDLRKAQADDLGLEPIIPPLRSMVSLRPDIILPSQVDSVNFVLPENGLKYLRNKDSYIAFVMMIRMMVSVGLNIESS